MDLQSIITFSGLIMGFLAILAYFKGKEKDNLAAMKEQKSADEQQNQKIALLEQRVASMETNSKDLKGEVLEKVEKIDAKVDDLKLMFIQLLTKNKGG